MARQGAEVEALHQPQVPWTLAVLVFIEAALVAGLGFALVTGAPRFLGVIVFFLLLRIVADLAKAFGRRNVLFTGIDGHVRAASWPVLGIGLWAHFGTSVPVWVWGAGVLLAGLSLWGHHSQAARVSLGLARAEGLVGAWASVAGAGIAATVFDPPAPWDLVVPVAVAALAGVFALRATVRLLGDDPRAARARAGAGWTGWYQEHFFRLTVMLVALVAYLFVRETLRGFVPMLTLFEWAAASMLIGVVLWTLRNHLRGRLVEHPVQSPHQRHERHVARHGEPEFDAIEAAVGRFLDDGETQDVATLRDHMQGEGLPVQDAFRPILSYRRRTDLLLMHPAWLYTARILVVVLLAWGVRLVAPASLALFVLGVGLWFVQFNRFGGPWWVKSLLAVAAYFVIAAVPLTPWMTPPVVAGLSYAAWLPIVTLLPAVVHPLRARKGKPVPLYAYHGTDPTPAIDRLRQLAEQSLVRRAIWLTVGGVVVVIVLGEVTRFLPDAAILLNVYVLLAAVLLTTPVLRVVGLRIGRAHVTRRHVRERLERQRRVQDAFDRTRTALGV